MVPFNYIELFSGVGGFRMALDELGGHCVFASEIDKYAQQSYKAIYGDSGELHGDITKIAAADIPDHDVLVGGFPCQAFSVAGQRKGFEDTRGTLFFEIARIAAEKKPRLLLLENVKGLLSHDGGNTFEVMCRTLNEIGYAIDFRVLNSKYFGVPQNRERIFIVADRITQHEPWADIKGNDVVTKAKRNAIAFGVRSFNFDWPAEGDVTVRLRDVLEPNVDEKYYLSEDKTAKLLAQLAETPEVENIPLTDGGRLAGWRVRDDRVFAYQSDAKRSTAQEHIYLRDGAIADSVTVGHMPKYLENPHAELQEYSDGSGLSYCVDANYAKGSSPGDVGKGRRTHVVENRYRIRKLTPLECWRLQGFPDAAHETAKLAGVSDSQRYKQAGNAVTVNVISAIGKRLIMRLNVTEPEVVAVG